MAKITAPPVAATNPSLPQTVLQLGVDPTGKVDSCIVAESSGVPRLDARACAIAIDKARYAVTSTSGRPRRQMTRLRISWPANLAELASAPVPVENRPVIQPKPPSPPVSGYLAVPAPISVPHPHVAPRSNAVAAPPAKTYAEKLAAQRGVRGRNVEQGWTISD